MLASAGLAPDALDRPENRIPYEALGRLLRESAIRTRCAHLGLLVGRMCHLADLGLLGELVRNRATVGEALQSLVVHQHMNSGGGLAFLVERGGMVDLGYAIYHPGVTGTNQVYDSVLAAAFNFLRELCGTGYLPSEVFFPYSKPVDTTHYRNLFKVQPRFNAEFCALRFPAYWMELPVAGCDPERLRLAQERVANADPDRLIQQVYRALRVLLLQGKKSGDDLARMLSMHRRTLNRRLSGEGTTFQKVLDAVRFEVARQLLANSEVALDDVAATLGYAGVSPFMRSFRRWAGTTPGQWRRAAMADPPGDGASDYRLRFRRGLTGDAATRVPPASVS
jgi:AraC-like DNA-binding protein